MSSVSKIFSLITLVIWGMIPLFGQNNGIALNLDGINDYTTSSYYGILDSGARSLECWIRTSKNYDGNTGGKQGVIANYGDFNTSNRWTFNIYRRNAIRIEVQGNGLSGNIDVCDGKWHHVAVTYNHKDSLDYRLYVDGKLDTADNLTVPTNTTKKEPFIIGMRIDQINHFEGDIDELRFYNYALSASEIANNYNLEFCNNPKGLVLYYKMNDGKPNSYNGSKKTAIDYSGNNYDGTLTNFGLSNTYSNWVYGAGLKGGPDEVRKSYFDCDTVISPSGKYKWTRYGIYRDTFTNQYGCDSIILATVNIGNDSNVLEIENCGPYTSPGGTIAKRDTFFTEYYSSIKGCDSVVSYDVTIHPLFDTTIKVSACESFTSPAGNYTEVDTSLIDSFYSVFGCDSIVHYNVDIHYNQYRSDTVFGCDSAKHLGITYTISQLVQNKYSTIHGCDSVQVTLVRINRSSLINEKLWGCDSAISPSGVVYRKDGLYTEFFTSQYGCDSTVNYNISIQKPFSKTDSIYGCENVSFRGIEYDSNQMVQWIGKTIWGCDSVIKTQIMLSKIDTSVIVEDSIIRIQETNWDSIFWYDCYTSERLEIINEPNLLAPVTSRYRAEIFKGNCSRFTYCFKLNRVNSVKRTASKQYLVYPNPSDGNIRINGLNANDKIEIIDLNGRELQFSQIDGSLFNIINYTGVAVIQIINEYGAVHHLLVQIN